MFDNANLKKKKDKSLKINELFVNIRWSVWVRDGSSSRQKSGHSNDGTTLAQLYCMADFLLGYTSFKEITPGLTVRCRQSGIIYDVL